MLYEYKGNIHLHSTYSDGEQAPEAIAGIAAQAGLDFLILTDHQTLAAWEKGEEGYYGPTLLLVGMEVNEWRNHYLALDIARVVADNEDDPQQVINEVNRQGGIGVLAHPIEYGSKYYKDGITFPWTDWSVHDFQGVEIWNYLSRYRDEFTGLGRGLRLLLYPAAFLKKGPYREVLTRLDELHRDGHRVYLYGGSDAHGITVKCLIFTIAIASYQEGFRSINMHVLAEEAMTRNLAHDREQIYQSLRSGRSWVACDYYKDSTGFRFFSRSKAGIGQMGSSTPYRSELIFYVQTPAAAEVVLYGNGNPCQRNRGRNHRFFPTEPGVYRIEAYHRQGWGWHPWIYSNPIWLE